VTRNDETAWLGFEQKANEIGTEYHFNEVMEALKLAAYACLSLLMIVHQTSDVHRIQIDKFDFSQSSNSLLT